MATDPVDVKGLVADAGDARWSGMPAGAVMGHLHLHVGDLATASGFYSDAVGLDRMVWQYPGALFLAANGYHHHLGTNTWAGPGATAPDEHTAQLLEWTIVLPDARSLESVASSLGERGHAYQRSPADGAGWVTTRDPWGTPLRLAVG
jgi:catechol 2,3-dioxygenase